jgi:hypothetical protein
LAFVIAAIGDDGDAIDAPPDEVPPAVAGEGIEGQEEDVGQQDQRPNADMDTVLEEEGLEGVIPEETQDHDG